MNPTPSRSPDFISPLSEGQGPETPSPTTHNNNQVPANPALAFYFQGRLFHDRCNFKEAFNFYQQAIELDPNLYAAYNDLGTLCQSQGRDEEAIHWYQKAISLNPDFAEVHYNLGNIYKNRNRSEEALHCWQRAVDSDPNLAEAYFNLGVIYYEKEQPGEAIPLWEKAIQIKPDYVSAQINLATALKRQGRLNEAIQYYREAIQLEPNEFLPWVNLGDIYSEQKNLSEAISCYRKALTIDPCRVEVYMNLGCLAMDQGQPDGAILCYQKSLELNPGLAEAHYNIANAYKDKGEMAKAITHYKEAIRFRPDYNEAYNNLAITLHGQGHFAQSIFFFKRALELKPDRSEVLSNLGNVYKDQRRMAEARQCYEKAISLDPDYPEGHWNLSLTLLMTGCFEEGWPEYEWRWKIKGVTDRPEIHQPLWDGRDLSGKRLLLHAEQGFGDTIQFFRYIPLIVERGGRVILECQPELFSLLTHQKGIEKCLIPGQKLPDYDYHCPLLSLPLFFRTNHSTIPAQVPYLSLDPVLVQKWQERLAPDRSEFKCGLVWAGKPTHSNDRNRSFTLQEFGALAGIPEIGFYSLQKGEAACQVQRRPAGMNLTDLSGELIDFAETGALIENLDLLITVDTAVAHLAGALGKSVWTLLPFSSDWRWLLERRDSPWYPTMRLFRQSGSRDWAGLLRQVAAELKMLVSNPKAEYGAGIS